MVGPCGYPLDGELNLKQLAVTAGLGNWGKISLVIHPIFGPWLRLTVVRIKGVGLSCTGPGEFSHKENMQCTGCSACLNACQLGLLEPYFLQGLNKCRARVSRSSQIGRLVTCDLCLVACPVGKLE